MSPPKLPRPEEYGRRLAAARRRQEKRAREKARKTETSFERVLTALEEQKAALAAVSAEMERLPREVSTPGDLHQAYTELSEQLRLIRTTVENIDLDIPSPAIPESLQQTLDDLLQMKMQPVQISPPPPVKPEAESPPAVYQETIFTGPITLKVTGRDREGNIDEVDIEPTRH